MFAYDLEDLFPVFVHVDLGEVEAHHIAKRITTSSCAPIDEIWSQKICDLPVRFDCEGFGFLKLDLRLWGKKMHSIAYAVGLYPPLTTCRT
jgi:hypothetical protein